MTQPLAELERGPFPRLVCGYWFGPSETPPPFPHGLPHGAVLPKLGTDLHESELICLDLVSFDDFWLVLSEVGRYTYRHTTGLLYDEEFHFVPEQEAIGTWPIRFRVEYAESIAPAMITVQYGDEAYKRARKDADAVQLRLVRCE